MKQLQMREWYNCKVSRNGELKILFKAGFSRDYVSIDLHAGVYLLSLYAMHRNSQTITEFQIWSSLPPFVQANGRVNKTDHKGTPAAYLLSCL